MTEPSQDFLWECIDALAGYSPRDLPPEALCPECGCSVDAFRRDARTEPIYGGYSYDPVAFTHGRDRYYLMPCGHEATEDELQRLIQIHERRKRMCFGPQEHLGRFE